MDESRKKKPGQRHRLSGMEPFDPFTVLSEGDPRYQKEANMSASKGIRLFDDEADALMSPAQFPQRLTLLPGAGDVDRMRIMWGQDMIRDLVDGRYRTVVCGVNDTDNSHGVVSQLVDLVPSSQWSAKSVTSYARMFQESVGIHAMHDKEPFVLKFDLDSILILALLRPKGKDHFTLSDLSRGFRTVQKMLADRRDRGPSCTVSFLNAKANRLVGADGGEPSFETVLRTMYQAGFRGDAYPPIGAWNQGGATVFPTYPFPEGLDRMRQGSS